MSTWSEMPDVIVKAKFWVRPMTTPGPAGGMTPTTPVVGVCSPTSKKKLGIA